nr:MAG TPA: hypothetical protein [Caudoviricetes sp.]
MSSKILSVVRKFFLLAIKSVAVLIYLMYHLIKVVNA